MNTNENIDKQVPNIIEKTEEKKYVSFSKIDENGKIMETYGYFEKDNSGKTRAERVNELSERLKKSSMDNNTNIENKTYEKYLPVGTVVMLKEGKKRAMITGFCCIGDKEKNKKVFDYSGCLYPEGFISANKFLLFDHEQIDKIYFLGYQDEEEKVFKERLNRVIDQMNKQEENPM